MINIRKLTYKDEKELTKVYSETVYHDFPEYTEKTRKFFLTRSYRDDMFSLKSKFGMFRDKKMIGYLVVWGPHGGVAYIYWFAILKAFRNQGLGGKFLEWFENWCLKQGVHNIQLQADERNLKFYKERGYEVWGADLQSYFGIDTNMLRKLIQKPKEKNYLKLA